MQKRKEVIIATFIIILFSVVVFTVITKPMFRGTSKIEIVSKTREVDPFRREFTPRRIDVLEFRTHIVGVTYTKVMEKVVLGQIKGKIPFWRCPKCNVEYKHEAIKGGRCPDDDALMTREWPLKYPDWEPLHV
ncbi:MAG: hypothetical protein KAI64_07670, partial [Thermoplasmata archaeon]|nr:hypothetical protein [Thermoplasmata archaeon]